MSSESGEWMNVHIFSGVISYPPPLSALATLRFEEVWGGGDASYSDGNVISTLLRGNPHFLAAMRHRKSTGKHATTTCYLGSF